MTIAPKTSATFRVLEHFHIESAQAGVFAQAFYNTLTRHTDNTGLSSLTVCNTFLRMMREWRYLKALKRGGQGHDPGGRKNLPLDWEHNVSSDDMDPSLTNGQAYFIEEMAYKDHVETFGKTIKEETNTCNNHDAAKLANVKGYESLAASGVVSVQCTRHEMRLPCSIGDLQHGERLLFGAFVVVSYNITCQWSRNFWKRIRSYQGLFDYNKVTMFLVPKFHLPAHQDFCKDNYSFHFTRGVAHTDGEGIERGWSLTNIFGPSTKEMGPGARRDLLDDVFGDHNWRKIVRLISSLLKRAKQAAKGCYKYMKEFEAFNAAIPSAQAAQWGAELDAWEHDSSNKNLFTATIPALTQAAVRRRLAEQEAVVANCTQPTLVWHQSVSPSSFISTALVLEDQQIEVWFDVQPYIPGVDTLRALLTASKPSEIHAEMLPLLLPSQIHQSVSCHYILLDYEWQLWEGQAYEALDNLRLHLCLRSYLVTFKNQWVSGQRPTTRARSIINAVQRNINNDAATYRASRDALITLTAPLGKSGLETTLRDLVDSNIRAITSGEMFETEGHRTMSWIWKTSGVAGSGDSSDPDLHDMLHIEWCKARARADRWKEECDLVQEEMRWVLQFFDWQSKHWQARADAVPTATAADSDSADGLVAYARRQADLRWSMRMETLESETSEDNEDEPSLAHLHIWRTRNMLNVDVKVLLKVTA
ncbi:hypothetical protein CERSUDRAFT_75291 [Gelatoporia subvermispora B]|uniref:CxC2-like cysteine cluster KDZ transposase-associated domain-containing protein n=1 Tax=Ceriporiopsis subvermispora (strain B) TaxID=914234 RepID=M2R8F0_CERS8|nr:hypothetical protein CERSUDRAFT_75291 [Gelatoporia subvermispora B]